MQRTLTIPGLKNTQGKSKLGKKIVKLTVFLFELGTNGDPPAFHAPLTAPREAVDETY